MAKDIVVGSGNADKARELQTLLQGTSWNVRSLSEFPPVQEPEEDQDTFEGNALLKARYYSNAFNLPCVADDSGLSVDALNGAPGVYSARYAGLDCTYSDNNEKLLRELADVPEDKRTARFVCCAAYSDIEGKTHIIRGTVEGCIAPECRGDNGFGYDPLFIPNGYTQTFGELSPEVKHYVSHRGQAFQAMSAWLNEQHQDE